MGRATLLWVLMALTAGGAVMAPSAAQGWADGQQVAQAVEQARQAAAEAVQQAASAAAQVAGPQETASGDLINRGGGVEVPADKTVKGDVVAINGPADIRGKVDGNVVAVNGSIHVYDGGQVKGDTVAIGGDVIRDPNAQVGGSKLQLSAEWADQVLAAHPPAPPVPPAPPSPPAPPAPGAPKHLSSGDVVAFGQAARVGEDEVVDGDVAAFGGPVDVRGKVNGDVVSFGGPVDIRSEVTGDVVTFGSPVHLYANAVIGGDVTAMGGSLTKDEGAVVKGSPSLTSLWGGVGKPVQKPAKMVTELGWWLIGWMFWLVLMVLTVLIAPRQTDAVANRIAAEPGRTFVYGLVGSLLILPILVLLLVLIVTWVVIPFYLLALLLLALLGGTGVDIALGRVIARRLNWPMVSLLGLALIGLALEAIVNLSSLAPMGNLIAVPIAIVLSILGLGGALMTGFGFDPSGTWLARRMAARTSRAPAPAAAPSDPLLTDEPFSPEAEAALREVAAASAPGQEASGEGAKSGGETGQPER